MSNNNSTQTTYRVHGWAEAAISVEVDAEDIDTAYDESREALREEITSLIDDKGADALRIDVAEIHPEDEFDP